MINKEGIIESLEGIIEHLKEARTEILKADITADHEIDKRADSFLASVHTGRVDFVIRLAVFNPCDKTGIIYSRPKEPRDSLKWIDIKDRHPGPNNIVVVYSAGTYYPPAVAFWETGHGFTAISGDRRTCWAVSHWMPLPKYPNI